MAGGDTRGGAEDEELGAWRMSEGGGKGREERHPGPKKPGCFNSLKDKTEAEQSRDREF